MKAIYQGRLHQVIGDTGDAVRLDDGFTVDYSDPQLVLDPTDDQVSDAARRQLPAPSRPPRQSGRYATRDRAAAAWLAQAKRDGRVTVRGGGWWYTPYGHVQGLTSLGGRLVVRGQIVKVLGDEPGTWAWQVVKPAQAPAAAGDGGAQ